MRLFRHGFVKKKLVTLALCVFCLAALSAIHPLMGAVQTEAVQKVPQDLVGVTVFVDAGHGGYDGGSRAKDSGVWEKVFNLSVALKTRDALEKRGAAVLMSREADEDLCDDDLKGITKKRQDLKRRLDIAQQGNADLVLSIHMNEYRNRRESGPHVFYRKNHDASRLLAGCMQQALIDALEPVRKRVAQSGDYYMLSLDTPSILIECGFLSNAKEEALLLTDTYQQRVADAIADGVAAYLKLVV